MADGGQVRLAAADSETKPCSLRMNVGGRIAWCVRDDGHDGPHAAMTPRVLAANVFAPRSK